MQIIFERVAVIAAPEDQLFTVDEVAERLRLHPDSVYRRVETGELRAVRLGAGLRAPIRIAAEELERYLHGGALTEHDHLVHDHLRGGAATEHDRARPSTKADGAR